ncbi:MAG: TolC family protein [Candidatus Omnitrophota bacterium]|jgi:outer membrane protein TolC
MKLRSIIMIMVFAILPLGFGYAEELSLTIDEALALALRNNASVLLKQEDVQKAKASIAEARSALLPALTAKASLSDTRGLYGKDISQASSQLSVKQYLYKGGAISNTIKQNEFFLAATEAGLDAAKQEIALNVKKAFYTLLFAGKFAALNKSILENTRAHYAMVKERYAFGQASESEVLTMEQSLRSVQEAYDSSLNELDSGRAVLNNVLFVQDDVVITLRGELGCEPEAIAYDEAFLKAMRMRPEIKQYEALEKESEKAIEVAKADSRPSVYASWDYYSATRATASAAKNNNDYNILGVTVSWPVFDGWAAKAKVQRALVDLKQSRLSKEKVIKDIRLEVKNAYLGLKNSLSFMQLMQSQVVVYQDTLLTIQDKSKAGIASTLDLNDASLGYQISLFNQEQSMYDYIIAKARFDLAVGG